MSEPTITPPGPSAPAPPPPPAPRRGVLLSLFFSLAGYLLSVAAALGLVLGGIWWLLSTEPGTAWLLARVPVVQFSGVRGALFGDFQAESVELPLPGEGARLALQGLSWRGPTVHSASGGLWLRIGLDELHLRRVDLHLSSDPSPPTRVPDSLALPIGFDLAALRIDELHIDGIDTPLRDLRARLSLGADGGASHRLDDVTLSWDRLRATGQAQVATAGPLEVAAKAELTQQLAASGEWQATLQLNGPLAAPQLQAHLRAQPAPPRPAQTLDASATLLPFATWPLGELQATARGFDVSALHSAAPATALDLDASVSTQGMDQPAAVSLTLNNRAAGRWNEGRLPLRRLRIELKAQPDTPSQLDVRAFEAELGTTQSAAGRLSGSGSWNPASWRLDTRLSTLRPALLDARAPAMRLDGPLRLEGSGFDGSTAQGAQISVRGNLEGQLLERGPAQPVQLRLDAQLGALRIELRELLAQAGGATASLTGQLTRATASAAWAARGQARLREFDPLPWWPGREDSAWRQGPHRLNATADVDLLLPASAATLMQQLAQTRGRAQLNLDPSRLAGVPISGTLSLQSAPQGKTLAKLQLDADGNSLLVDGQLGALSDGAADRWELKADMPALKRLQPLWRLALDSGADPRLAGALSSKATVSGRWPALATQGELDAADLQIGEARAQHSKARWALGTRGDAPLDLWVELKQVALGKPSAESLQLKLQGTLAAHQLELRAESKALPPAWVESVRATPSGALAQRTLALLQLQGSALGVAAQGLQGWRGSVQKLDLRGDAADAPSWLSLRDVAIDLQWANGPLRAKVDAGRAELLGAVLDWKHIAWSAADPGRAPAQLDAEARLEPLELAPLLARVQPRFGWGGDLRIGGSLKVRSAPNFSADVVIERSSGDLSVTDDSGKRTLGLSDLRVGLNANDGVWSFTTGLAGQTLGQAAGAVVVRTSPKATWPAADAPVDGVLELQIANLGVWSPWLPPGWRLAGTMRASATFGGRFGAPEYTGELSAKGVGVRNVLQGVDVRDGDVSIVLLGDTAHIERFTANAGSGNLSLRGDASLGAEPRAELALRLDSFQLLGRVDRRIVTTGDAVLKLGRDTLALDGDFKVDEGLIDFSRSDAPQLSDDVHVLRGGIDLDRVLTAEADAAVASARARHASLDLRVQLGEKLRVRGQGLDAGLRGELRMTAPQGRLRVDGSVRTAGGTYRAYRQRLDIERGVLTFNGPIANPQLDIVAIRPNLDVRVGVSVTGTVLVPRVRLFSDPDMSDAEKLSWLLRGRASEGQGSGDTALLQAAAVALLAGDEPGTLDQLFNLIGLDDLSLRQSDSVAGGTIVSVGKQLSRNWYVGYERGLNATTGNWQLIYRVAQRFTIRAQSGESNSIELIWSWRWQ
ncbi:MAG TPA: translocation/assembly module TamB domain-containing protein [Rubrivivax sp.]|nr:translocation/assembly module TamB domain-containing protein [Rubrivivax sp.]